MSDRREPGSLIALFSLGHLANDWAPGAVWLLTPAIAVSLALSPAEVGLLLTIHSVGAAAAYLPAGVLADRVSDRGRLLLVTFWWVAIGYALAALAPGFWTLALLLAVAGMGDAAWHPIATGVLVEGMPHRRASAGDRLADGAEPSTRRGMCARSSPVAASISSDQHRFATSSHRVPEASDISATCSPLSR